LSHISKLYPTIWLTGLSASGKTTLARRLRSDLEANGIRNIELLDGDILRNNIEDYDYSTENRNNIGLRKARLALDCNKQGKIAIVTGIAHHKETRERIRKLICHYIEVYLRCPVEACAKRDIKGNYNKALKGDLRDFVGVTEPYQESDNPDLILDTFANSSDECAKILLEYTLKVINSNA